MYSCDTFRSEEVTAGIRCLCSSYKFSGLLLVEDSVMFQIKMFSTMVSEDLWDRFMIAHR